MGCSVLGGEDGKLLSPGAGGWASGTSPGQADTAPGSLPGTSSQARLCSLPEYFLLTLMFTPRTPPTTKASPPSLTWSILQPEPRTAPSLLLQSNRSRLRFSICLRDDMINDHRLDEGEGYVCFCSPGSLLHLAGCLAHSMCSLKIWLTAVQGEIASRHRHS